MALDHFSVTRNTTKTVLNKNGVLETVPAGVPAFEFNPDGTFKGCLIEPNATNLLQRSEEFDNAYWSKSNLTVVANNGIAPNGTTTADLIHPATTGTFRRIANFTAFGATDTFSFFAKQAGFRYVSTPNLVGAVALVGVTFDLQDGVVAYVKTGEGITAKIIPYPNGWYRCVVKSSGTGVQRPYILLSDAPNSTTATANGTDGVLIWGAQLETSPVATSYIPTTTSTVTRNADVIDKTGASGLIGQTEGTVYAEVDMKINNVVRTALSINDGTNNNRININIAIFSDNQLVSVATNFNGSSTVVLNNANNTIGANKICVTYSGTTISLYVNGVKIGSQTTTGFGNFNRISAGINAVGSGFFNDHIRSFALEKRALTEAEAIKRTTL